MRTYQNDEPFDYIEVAIGREDHPLTPESLRGMSGGGAWHVVFGVKASDPERKIIYQTPYLVGVAFYEYGTSDGRVSLRLHGPRSIYRTLVSEVRAKKGDGASG